jgi:hypothetical protein
MIKYYPPSKIIENQSTTGNDYTLNGTPYTGKYYVTFDGTAYTGANPIIGKNELLEPATRYRNAPILDSNRLPTALVNTIAAATPNNKNLNTRPENPPTAISYTGGPTPYYPYPIPEDYDKGYIIRYFAKRRNSQGYIIEISELEYNSIQNGTAPYDISMYMVGSIFWKLTGPLNFVRLSQYNTRAGIIDTNKRLVENLDKTMLGMVEFIDGEYDKYARPTTV